MADARWDLAARLLSVQVSTLRVWGEADAISPVAMHIGAHLQGAVRQATA